MENIFEKIDYRNIGLVIIILMGSVIMVRLVRIALRRYIDQLQDTKDKTALKFLQNTASLIILTLAGLLITYTIPALRTLAVTLFASAGIFAAFVGFASQNAFSNIVSGIFIVIFKPFRVGDFIQVGTSAGIVEDITLRHTVIKGIENRRIIIPNSTISTETINNASIKDSKTCKHIEIWVNFEADLDNAMEIMRQVAMAHPDCIDNRTDEQKEKNIPIVDVKVTTITEIGIFVRAYVWSKDPVVAFDMACDILYTLKKQFDENQIKFGFPNRKIHLPEKTTLSLQKNERNN